MPDVVHAILVEEGVAVIQSPVSPVRHLVMEFGAIGATMEDPVMDHVAGVSNENFFK